MKDKKQKDPFYSEENQRCLLGSLEQYKAGKVTSHDLIDDSEAEKNLKNHIVMPLEALIRPLKSLL